MGFPERPQRIGFGPEMRNKRPPINAETDLTADQMNLDFWQMAGAGRTLPMTVILFDGGGTPAVIFQAAAYDPNQELANIAFVKNGTGDYTFTFESTYNNEKGQPISFVPRMSMAMVQGGAAGTKATPFVPDGQDISVEVRDVNEAFIDGTFILAVW